MADAKLCQIQWVDDKGNTTGDSNPAIGEVYIGEYIDPQYGLFRETVKFPICARHKQRLADRGMHHWQFIPYTEE